MTVVIHALGSLATITHLARRLQRSGDDNRFMGSEIQVVRVVSILLLLHLAEASVWAGFYVIAGLLPDTETAIYFSITSYTTVGYGDVLLPASWRLLGPIEAAVGILMFGWSTGIMVTALARIYRNRLHLPDQPTAGNDPGDA
ncbi:MAG: potassium channel family protein [Gemmataceae bacterium]|nr:potassium channel family protein [Gemmataceae bacterium]